MVAGGGSGAGAFAGGAWAARFGAGASGASAGRFLSSAPLRFSASSLACLAASERTKMLVVSCRSVCPCTDQRGLLNFSTQALKEDVPKKCRSSRLNCPELILFDSAQRAQPIFGGKPVLPRTAHRRRRCVVDGNVAHKSPAPYPDARARKRPEVGQVLQQRALLRAAHGAAPDTAPDTVRTRF